MSLSITSVCRATDEEWDNIWKECSYSTYFHSREWAEIWADYTKRAIRPDPMLIRFSDGKQALLPFSFQKSLKGLVKRYISSPGGTFGGWLSLDDLHIDHALLTTKYIARKCGNLVWRLNPYDKFVFDSGTMITKNDVTHALHIKSGFDALHTRWAKNSGSIQRKARKALREGVSIKSATSLEDWQKYYEIYQDSLKRWGEKASSVYDWQFFNTVLVKRSPHIKLWLAVHQDNVIAGALCFYAKEHVVYWHGAALAQHFELRPVNLLMCEIIRNSYEQGYAWFDFNPSGGHEGVRAFKESFGADALPSPVVFAETRWTRLVTRIGGMVQNIRA